VYSFMCHHRYLSSDFHFHCNPFFNSLNLHTVTRLLIIGEVRKVSESAEDFVSLYMQCMQFTWHYYTYAR
jgi:hypothetical protein